MKQIARAFLALLLLAPSAFAQLVAGQPSSHAIRGRVIDSTGATLPGVTIEVTPASGGKTLVVVTDANGAYRIDLPAGRYDVACRLINFATSVRRNVDATGGEATVNTTLYLSSSAEVVVTAKQTFRNLTDMIEPVNDLLGIADAATVGVITAKEIEARPFQRAGEIMETVPGVIVSQHSGEGKATQYYLRGFNLDHGTDIAISVAGVPVNMPTHAHGQGYADANFLIPELVSAVQYKKGPYYADEGDFASAGAVNIDYLNVLDHPVASVEGGSFQYERVLYADSPKVAGGYLLYGLEAGHNNGPWVRGDDLRKLNGILRYTRGNQQGGFSITAMAYDAKWSSTDQVPQRAIDEGLISRFGLIDPSDGGNTHRYSLSSEWQRSGNNSLTHISAYGIAYKLNLFSDFTYFLDDPIQGDQFEQADDRKVAGFDASHRWIVGRTENVIGAQGRYDDIGKVGLYHTSDREVLSTIRQDGVHQSSISVYGQSAVQWTPWFRSLLGVRGDSYRFNVASDNPLNSGRASASIVSPKLSMIFGPWDNTELYANAGYGFHSNDGRGATITVDPSSGDPVARVDPLVRTKGAEVGFRTKPFPKLHLTAALWGLDIASELLFTGDAGTTEASRPSQRTGVELAAFYNIADKLALDTDYAYSRARFRDFDPVGDHIPGAVEGVSSVGLTMTDVGRFSAMLRYRYFGPRPLIEDNSVRSAASNLVSARIAYAINQRFRVNVDLFNIFNAEVSDIDYYYTSRLQGEPAEGVNDIHTHPAEPRSFRVGISTVF